MVKSKGLYGYVYLYNSQYLLIVDYYSKFIEVSRCVRDTKSTTVIEMIKFQFVRHGIPTVAISDNGPQFSSYEFKLFSQQYDFKHITSPRYPRSNVLAETAVQTVKKVLKKAKQEKEDP